MQLLTVQFLRPSIISCLVTKRPPYHLLPRYPQFSTYNLAHQAFPR